jgi:hypothetical protein
MEMTTVNATGRYLSPGYQHDHHHGPGHPPGTPVPVWEVPCPNSKAQVVRILGESHLVSLRPPGQWPRRSKMA